MQMKQRVVHRCVRFFLTKRDQQTFIGASNLVLPFKVVNKPDNKDVKRAKFFMKIVRQFEATKEKQQQQQQQQLQ